MERELPFPLYVFDAYGTLFDVHSAVARHGILAGPQADRLSEIWRAKQLEYTWTRSLMGAYRDFDAPDPGRAGFRRRALRRPDSGGARNPAFEPMKRSTLIADAAPALEALAGGGAKDGDFVQWNAAGLARAVRSAGLQDLLDESLSADALRIFKTAPAVL